ncbi:signal transduction histidine kinase [Virgibacillus natechei]|uniref:Heme sensor protein HssS n=1 Tax=Virgibacillus natechei TaxID=1216297 RepID=A0ABS4IGB0_9BACI|nr:HAMP domain-containing sensor histidine kinase [Virgibacillus natechei]MBP1969988.1 signal transduction histidine kinase [Virgibacillus natechei]UZD13354.1 HAMP domain-containing histidine kinase [Virgibacillus natechei]
MRTLYVRIIVTTMGIMIASAIIAFAVSNIHYQHYLKPENDQKVTEIAENIVSIYEGNDQHITAYLTAMAELGYKFYLMEEGGEGQTFGEPFESEELNQTHIESVLNGNVYHGIANYPWRPFVTGFFDNELKNTIGVPIQLDGAAHALFVRPDSAQQFGEMRIFLAVMLGLTLLFSFILVVTSTRFIVNPIKRLTEATKKIAAGNYHIKLDVKRRDEIGRLANDFTKMSDKLEQTEEKRQEFVSSVSHEIQSPLTSIQGFSQALREEILSEEESVRYLDIIEKESKRLSALSKQLLTLSFLDRGIENNDMQPFDVAGQLKEVVLATEWQWLEKEIEIEMDVSPATVIGDHELLQQVWMNLVTNAIRYTNQGGRIRIRTVNEKATTTIVIEDTGIGIAEAEILQIFDRFYKVDKARTRTENSTGLGLAIVKKIIELHDGSIMVESELGQGSTFIVNLSKA